MCQVRLNDSTSSFLYSKTTKLFVETRSGTCKASLPIADNSKLQGTFKGALQQLSKRHMGTLALLMMYMSKFRLKDLFLVGDAIVALQLFGLTRKLFG